MAKSALDRFLAQPKKKIAEQLDCPHEYGISGVYSKPDGTCYISEDYVTDEQCRICWTQKT